MLTRTSFALTLTALCLVVTCCNGGDQSRVTGVQVTGDYKCAGWVHYFEDGTLKQFKTAKPITLAAGTIPAKSTVFLDREGRVTAAWLSETTDLDGIPCRGGFGKIETSFHENGTLASTFLARDTDIKGVPCMAGVFVPVIFYPDGKLKSCRLASDTVVAGLSHRKGETLELPADGAE